MESGKTIVEMHVPVSTLLEKAIKKARMVRCGLASNDELWMDRDGVSIPVNPNDREVDVYERYMDEKRRIRDETYR